MIEVLCVCGHPKSLHEMLRYWQNCYARPIELAGGYCGCNQYKSDNLKYLEKLDAQRSSQ